MPSFLRLLLQSARTRCMSCTAVSSTLPDPMSIASSSASVSAEGPLLISRSLGRWSCDSWFMLSFILFTFVYL